MHTFNYWKSKFDADVSSKIYNKLSSHFARMMSQHEGQVQKIKVQPNVHFTCMKEMGSPLGNPEEASQQEKESRDEQPFTSFYSANQASSKQNGKEGIANGHLQTIRSRPVANAAEEMNVGQQGPYNLIHDAIMRLMAIQKEIQIRMEVDIKIEVEEEEPESEEVESQTLELSQEYIEIEQWMSKNQYFWSTLKPSQDPSFPAAIVMASANMKSNYAKYGDMLGFELIEGLAVYRGNCYTMGIFGVADNNSRPLLTGISFFNSPSVALLTKVAIEYCKIHRKIPQTLLTADIPEINQAVMLLMRKAGWWECNHLYDVMKIIQLVKDTLKNSQTDGIKRVLLALNEAIHTKSPVVYSNAMEVLQVERLNNEVLDKLLDSKSKVFYRDTKPLFFGLKRNLCTKLSEVIKPTVQRSNIIGILKQLENVDLTLTRQSAQFIPFSEDMFMKQKWAGELQTNYEKDVVQRFLENYLNNRVCVIDQTQVMNENEYTVRDASTRCNFEIRNWACSCKELEKTGVPCSHLLIVTQSVSNESLLKYIKPRWLSHGRPIKENQLKKPHRRR